MPAPLGLTGGHALHAVFAGLVAKGARHAGAGEAQGDVPFFFREHLGAKATRGGIAEVGAGQFMDEGLGVGAALAELDLDNQFARGGGLKAGPAPR